MWNAYTRSLSTFHLRWWQHNLRMLHFIVHQVVRKALCTFAYKLQVVTGQHVRNLLWPHVGNLFLISSSIVLCHEIRSTGRSWNEVKGIAGDRNAWKFFMDAICSTRSKRNWWWCDTWETGQQQISKENNFLWLSCILGFGETKIRLHISGAQNTFMLQCSII